MMGSEMIKRIVDMGTNLPLNVVIMIDDKYYEIDDVVFDNETCEGAIICTEKGSKWSARTNEEVLNDDED